MSTLQVVNIHFESTANTRLRYDNAQNSLLLSISGDEKVRIDSSGLKVGNSISNVSVNSTAFIGNVFATTINAGNSTVTGFANVIGNFSFSGVMTSNSATGSAGQVLTSAGPAGNAYWGTVVGVNVDSTYAWTNTQTFAANVTFNGSNSTVNAIFRVVNSTANVFFAAANGNIGIGGNVTPVHDLRVDGPSSLAGAVTDITSLAFSGTLTANSATGSAGQVLTSGGAGTNAYWSTVTSGGSGTVTSIGIGTGLSSTQTPLTTTGTISLATAGAGAANYASGISAISVDAYGRVTSVSGSAGYITSSGSISGSAGTFTSTSQDSRFNSIGVGTAAAPGGGAISASGDITAFASDERFKEDVKTIENALDKVNKIRGITYDHNELAQSLGLRRGERMAGVLAQEVERVLPEVVTLAPMDAEYDEDGNKYSKSGESYKTVKYDKIVALLIEAIKELCSQVDELKKKIGE